jgi:hypothetical protein
MTTPDGTKQARLSADTHRELMELAAYLGGTADDALRHLIGLSTIRVPVTDIQRQRWNNAAAELGVSTEEFVRLRIETTLSTGGRPEFHQLTALRRDADVNRETLNQIYYRVDALCRYVDRGTGAVDKQSTVRPAPVETPSTVRPLGGP